MYPKRRSGALPPPVGGSGDPPLRQTDVARSLCGPPYICQTLSCDDQQAGDRPLIRAQPGGVDAGSVFRDIEKLLTATGLGREGERIYPPAGEVVNLDDRPRTTVRQLVANGYSIPYRGGGGARRGAEEGGGDGGKIR